MRAARRWSAARGRAGRSPCCARACQTWAVLPGGMLPRAAGGRRACCRPWAWPRRASWCAAWPAPKQALLRAERGFAFVLRLGLRVKLLPACPASMAAPLSALVVYSMQDELLAGAGKMWLGQRAGFAKLAACVRVLLKGVSLLCRGRAK